MVRLELLHLRLARPKQAPLLQQLGHWQQSETTLASDIATARCRVGRFRWRSPSTVGDVGQEHPQLRNFGLKVGMVGTVKFDARLKELVETCVATRAADFSLWSSNHLPGPLFLAVTSLGAKAFANACMAASRVGA